MSCQVWVDNSRALHLSGDLTNRDADAVSLEDRGLYRLGNPALAEGVGDVTAVAGRGVKAMVAVVGGDLPCHFPAHAGIRFGLPRGD